MWHNLLWAIGGLVVGGVIVAIAAWIKVANAFMPVKKEDEE